MDKRIVHQIPPGVDNPRNSEGAFIKGKKGEILFAYSSIRAILATTTRRVISLLSFLTTTAKLGASRKLLRPRPFSALKM